MRKFLCFILCGVLLTAGLPVFAQATETTENEVSLEEFTNQLSNMIEKYDSNTPAAEEPVNSVNTFSVCADEEDEKDEASSYSTDRLIVKAEGDIDTLDAVACVEGYNDWHILQFENSESAEEALEYYENCKDVEYAQEDEIVRLTDFGVRENFTSAQHVESVQGDADTLGFSMLRQKLQDSNTTYSQQLTVAVVDTGIAYDHDFLKGRIDPNGFNAIDSSVSCYDDNGHGTHVSGIIAAHTLDNVTIKPYKVLNSKGEGTWVQVVLGIEAAIEDHVDVINMSFGGDGEIPIVDEVLAKAHKAGIILVAAAGNDCSYMDYARYTPACCDNVITVMAFDHWNRRKAPFSNYGSMCETAAIGESVISTWLNNRFYLADGTSMAAPFVSAAVTYLILDKPSITYDEIVKKIDEFEYREGMYLEFILDDNVSQVPTPELSVDSCEFDEEFYLEMTCSDPEAYISYTFSTSSLNSSVYDYEEPIQIKYDTVITAYAQRKGKKRSEEITVNYKRLFLNEEDKYAIDSEGIITKYYGENSENNTYIIIPDTINGITPVAIGESVFSGYTYVKNIILPNTVTKIKENAFRNCTSLEYITASGVTHIGQASFYKCSNIKEFIGNNVTEISNYAFYASSLPYINFQNVTDIGKSAFQGCTGIQSIISDTLTSIGETAFQGSSIRYVELPLITVVGENAFERCKNLETIIVSNATHIRQYAFNDCTSLKEINAEKVTSVAMNAFYNCINLNTAKLPVLKYVNSHSFYNCNALKNFDSPYIDKIYENAFENCTSLENVNYQYLTHLSDYAFKGCTALKNVNLPTLQTLGKDAFAGCSSLNEVWIKGDVTVEAGAFETDFSANKVILDNAISIKDLPENVPVALPLSVTSIEDTDFENVIIYGSKGSYGETWANENNQTFVEITTDNAIFQDVPEYCESTKDTLSFNVMGLNRIYQWYGNTTNSNTGGKFIKNATTSEFTPSSHTKIYDYYYCVVICQDGSNPLMTITSGVCTLIPVITSLLSATTVDLAKLSIKTSVTGSKNITDLIKVSDNATHYALPSYSNGKENYFGTGSSVVVYLNGEPDSVFNLVVYGDLNGDSVCDVLDCAEIEKAANKQITLNGNYFTAGDMNNNNKIDVRDYQSMVNKALAE